MVPGRNPLMALGGGGIECGTSITTEEAERLRGTQRIGMVKGCKGRMVKGQKGEGV